MVVTGSARLGIAAAGTGVGAMATGAVLFFAHVDGPFDWALGELLMRLGVGACLLGSIALVTE